MIVKLVKTLVLVLLLLLVSANVWASGNEEVDERFIFLGERSGVSYYGWSIYPNAGGSFETLWVKMRGFRNILADEGTEIDSILCRIGVVKVNGSIELRVDEQLHYDKSGTVVAHWFKQEWINQPRQSSIQLIAEECSSFLTAYFNISSGGAVLFFPDLLARIPG